MITTEVSADGLMAQLGDEIIESYISGSKAVGEIVNDLLAFQRKATKITKGTVNVEGYRELDINNRSILSTLLQLQESTGGYMYVDNDRVLHWKTDIGEDKGQQIRYRKNLIGIERDIDYGGYCTKLHPVSSNESLSDISLVKVTVDKDSDDDYGYLTLKETYACYNDWTGLGDALPANVHIYEQGEEIIEVVWASPTHYYDSEANWFWEYKMYDENTATYGGCLDGAYLPQYAQTEPLYLMVSSFPGGGTIQACGLRIMLSNIIDPGILVSIAVSPNSTDFTWVAGLSLDSSDNDVWQEVNFSKRTVWAAKIRILNYATARQYYVNEFDFKTEVVDESEVTADWHQGTDEHTLRCLKAEYNASAPYVVSYQYANYLMAWDKIIDADDIIAKVVINKYEAYAISILRGSILLLDELKEVPITYKISIIDLSKNRDFKFDFEALQLGSIVTVIDEDLGINVPVRVVSLTHPDLLSPEKVAIELSTRVKDISDYLVDLHKKFS